MKGKKLLAMLLCLVLCFSMFPIRVFAAEDALPGDTEETQTVEAEEAKEEPAAEEPIPEPVQDEAPVEPKEAAEDTREPAAEEPADEVEPALQDSVEPVTPSEAVDDSADVEKADAAAALTADEAHNETDEAAATSDDTVASGTCGENLTWTLDGEGTLTISGTGSMTNYRDPNYAPWLDNHAQIKEIVIEDGVTTIGDIAFYNCGNLTSITIPESITAIGAAAFYNCGSLTALSIPDGVTTIGMGAFYNCKALVNLTIPESVTSIQYQAFEGCSGLKTAGAIGSGCDYEFGWKTDIPAYAFSRCAEMISISLPESVTAIGSSTFSGCSGLTAITIPGGVTSIEDYTFDGCSSLTDITIPEGVTSIGQHAFDGCSSLTVITIPEGVTTIGDSAFEGCSSLTDIMIPASVTDIGEDAFYGDSNLECINVSSGNTHYSSQDGVLFDKGMQTLIYCPEGKTGTYSIPAGVTGIGYSAFFNCSLTSVTIPAGVTGIEEYAFSSCSSLKSVTIPESVTRIGDSAFYNCGLTSVTIPEGVTSIGEYTFSECFSLTSVMISEGVTSIGEFAFSECGLTGVTIPASVKSIGASVFYGCTDLTRVTIQEGATSIGDYMFSECVSLANVTIPKSVTKIGERAFGNCASLVKLTVLSSSIRIADEAFYECSGLKTAGPAGSGCDYEFGWTNAIPANAFSGCSGLRGITIPGSVTDIGACAFSGCSGLTGITIPGSVTRIGDYAFSGCSGLTGVTIPASVKVIGDSAFTGCDNVTDVYYEGTLVDWQNIDTGSTEWDLENAEFHFHNLVGSCGANLTWELDYKGNLYIRGSGAMDDYSEENPAPWYWIEGVGEEINSVTFGQGITHIGSWAFYGKQITGTLIIPTGVKSIGYQAFHECRNLEGVNLPNTLTTIEGEAFYVTALRSLTIPASVTHIGYSAFGECRSLTGVTVASGNTAYSSQDGVLFNKAKTQVVFYPAGKTGTSYAVPEGVTSIANYAFSYCDKLTGVTLPDSVKLIGDDAFTGCENLANLNIPSGVTLIGEEAFSFCESLQSVTIPAGVKEIGAAAFWYCDHLKSVTLSEGLESIDERAFQSCKSLKVVTIPASVKTIGEYAFSSCNSLNTIRFLGSAPITEDNVFSGVTATAYYPNLEDSWTADVRQNYGGTITWIGLGEEWIYYNAEKTIKLNSTIEECIFSTASTTYNEELAYYLMGLSRAAYKEGDILLSLRSLGFETENTRTSSDYQAGLFNDKYAAYALAKKQLSDGSTLVMITVRGTDTKSFAEGFLTDLDLGTPLALGARAHRGFAYSAERLYSDLKDFLGGSIPTDNITYVLTGHSLGAATANLVSVKLEKDDVNQSRIYDYNFACPDVGTAPIFFSNWESDYPNMFNIADARDPVAIVPGILGKVFSITGTWSKYGQSRWFAHNWTSSSSLSYTFSAHNKNNYVDYLSSQPFYSSFKTRTQTAAVRAEKLPKALFKVLGIKCPVDVVIYDSRGNALASVINGVPEYYDSEFGEVFIATMGDEKAIVLPEDGDYTVKLTGTDEGVMEYDVYTADAVTQEFTEEKVFEDVALTPGKEFVSEVNTDTEVPEVKLYVVDENEEPVMEVQEDGTETDLPESADKTALQTAVTAAEALTEADYTAESWTAMQTALSSAKAVQAKADATQAEVDAATTALNDAVTALVPATPAGVDKSQLEMAITYAEGLTASDYTVGSWSAVQTALSSAKTVYAKADATQDEVDAAQITLDNAIAALVPKGDEPFQFTDVTDSTKYYYNPVYWAADNGITKGYADGSFGVGRDCTRREILTFLWRFAGQPTGYGDARTMFNDMGKYAPSSAANKAVAWAYKEGIVKGYADGGIHPEASIIRKDVMIMLYRLAGKPAVSGTLKFTDCQSFNKNSDTYKAILWGSKNGITNGYSSGPYKGQFGCNLNCLREQIVTFLYRYNTKFG